MKQQVGFLQWTIIAGLALATGRVPAASTRPAIIPQPITVELRNDQFVIDAQTRIVAEGPARAEARKLIDYLAPAMGYRLERADAATTENVIRLQIQATLQDTLGPEGYRLDIRPDRIDLRAAAPAGLFYGIQTLRQLLDLAIFSNQTVEGVRWTMPCVQITDYPRFRWRGLLIDPARHFIPVRDVERFIDAMALHKLNRLQIHLTDNEGWRVEIKKYPKLTQVGSQMDWTFRYRGGTGPRHAGFYTQQEIRRLVRYAQARYITIIPEIEMPFHAGAAIVAYPEIGLNPDALAAMEPEQRWRRNPGLIAPRPATVAFLQDVLTEVIDLFPSREIHIGGDEANIGLWSADPEMQAQIKRLNLKDAHELHAWFIRQMDAFLTGKRRRLVGWDEILQGGLAPGAIVMSWHGTAGAVIAARAGHDVVLAPTSHTYFDYRQAPNERGLGNQVLPLEKVYAFEPVPPELDAAQAKHVLGGQGQLWGELITEPKRREWMAFPRACALAETLWSPAERRDYGQFVSRLAVHIERLQRAGINVRPLDAPTDVDDTPTPER